MAGLTNLFWFAPHLVGPTLVVHTRKQRSHLPLAMVGGASIGALPQRLAQCARAYLTATKNDPELHGFDEAKLCERSDAIVETDFRNNPPAFDF